MKYTEKSLHYGDASFEKPWKTSATFSSSASERLQLARHLVEGLAFVESALEYQLLMRELRKVLGGPPE